MKKSFAFAGTLLLLFCLTGFFGGEIDKNPKPIEWGGITLYPESVERSPNEMTLNKVKFTLDGDKGTIERIALKGDEVEIDHLTTADFTSQKMIIKGFQGKYQEGVEFFLSNGAFKTFNSSENVPDLKVAYYECAGNTMVVEDAIVNVEKLSGHDLSLQGVSQLKMAAIQIQKPGVPQIVIQEASVNKIILPADVENHPEQAIIRDFRLRGLAIPEMGARVENIDINYDNFTMKLDVEKATVPGEALKLLDISNPPTSVDANLQASAHLENEHLTARAHLDLINLLDCSAFVSGNFENSQPEKFDFTLVDKGIIPYISPELKAKLALGALMVPNGQAALASFLSRPNQTLEGAIDFQATPPNFSFSVK